MTTVNYYWKTSLEVFKIDELFKYVKIKEDVQAEKSGNNIICYHVLFIFHTFYLFLSARLAFNVKYSSEY